mgnify:CR=1 FL=1
MIPTMTTFQERAVLRDWVALNYCGEGAVVEIGALAGASTRALLHGIQATGFFWSLWVYDNFRLPGNQHDAEYRRILGADVGESFREIFDRSLGSASRLVNVLEGDAAAATVLPNEIEILHLDCAVSEDFHRAIYAKFFPLFVRGATLVQQDFNYKNAPYIAHFMKRMERFCKALFDVESSRYYEVVVVPTREEVEEAIK